MKNLIFIVNTGETYVNTYNGAEIDIEKAWIFERLEKKTGMEVLRIPMEDNLFYKYGVSVVNEKTVKLTVYSGYYENEVFWKEIYSAEACIDKTGIVEKGDCDLSFWHEYFGTEYGNRRFDELYVEKFEINDSMVELRKIFKMQLQPNPFLFFEKYSKLNSYPYKSYDISKFKNIPIPRTNRVVSKNFNEKYINYVWQHEIEVDGEVFYDLNIYSGNVKNGIIDIDEKHRIFLTSGWWGSPDGGEIGILVKNNTYGNIYNAKMKEKHPELLLDKYNGVYQYEYFLSREYIPCFEILAKAGLSDIADIMLDSYNEFLFKKRDNYYSSMWGHEINIWGKNDKEILGFKLSKLRNINKDAVYKNSRYHWKHVIDERTFPQFCSDVKSIVKRNPKALESIKNIDCDVFEFLSMSDDISDKTIDYVMKQNVGCWGYYRDYIRMCKQCGKYSGGIYPKDIKHEHDVMVTYMNQLKEAKNNIAFQNMVHMPEYLSLIYDGDSDDKYCILAPRIADDLVKESYNLSHCVRSYIGNVAMGSTRIYFLRNKEQKSKSVVTLEVQRGSIRQARGKANRPLTVEESKFVRKWAIEKGLDIFAQTVL